MWVLHTPSWTSAITYSACLGARHFKSGLEKPLLKSWSAITMNLDSLFLTFDACSSSFGSWSSFRYQMISPIHDSKSSVMKRNSSCSMLGCFRVSWITNLLFPGRWVLASLANKYALLFCSLGTCANLKLLNFWVKCLTLSRDTSKVEGPLFGNFLSLVQRPTGSHSLPPDP